MAERGFDNPVLDAQRVFRTLLTGLSEPGRVLALDPACLPPSGLDPAALAIILALCDGDTPLWLGPDWAEAAGFIRFHTGATLVADPGAASFLLASARHRPPLALLSPGTPDYPDRAATLVLAVDALAEGEGWQLSGPGIPGRRRFQASVDGDFLGEWRDNHARFPLGVDLFFAAGDRVAGLPRSTAVEG